MTKTRKDGDKRRDDHFGDIRRQRDANRKARDETNRSAAESARPGMATRAAIKLAAWGKDDKPIGIPQTKITVDSTTWASWIADAGRSWATFPGIAVLDERPIPDVGLGYDEGRRIFEMACDGASVKAIARELHKSREALGQPAGDFDHGDTELGIWGFFRQLDRYFGPSGWNPPSGGRQPTTSAPVAGLPRAKPPEVSEAQVPAQAHPEQRGADPHAQEGDRRPQPWSTLTGRCATKEKFLKLFRYSPRDFRSAEKRAQKFTWARHVKDRLKPTHKSEVNGAGHYYLVLEMKSLFETDCWTLNTPPTPALMEGLTRSIDADIPHYARSQPDERS